MKKREERPLVKSGCHGCRKVCRYPREVDPHAVVQGRYLCSDAGWWQGDRMEENGVKK